MHRATSSSARRVFRPTDPGPMCCPHPPFAPRKRRVIIADVPFSEAPRIVPSASADGDRPVDVMATSIGRAWRDLQVETLNLRAVEKGRAMSETKEPQIFWIVSWGAPVDER